MAPEPAAPGVRPAPGPTVRLSRSRLVGYGVGDTAGSVVTTVTGFYLVAYWLDVALLPAALLGTVFLVAQLWDAVTDPAVGLLADRTRSRWGRKRPWLLFGAVPLGLAYVLVWVVPPGGAAALFAYYLVALLLLRTAFTAVTIPYGALTPDLTPDYDERTRLNQYRFTFSIGAGLLAIALHPVFVELGGGGAPGHLLSAALWGAVIAAGPLVAFRATRERPAPPPDTSFREAVRALAGPLQSRAFRYTVGIYILSWTALLLVQTNLLLFVRYGLDAEAHFVGIVLVFQVSAIAFLAVWGGVSRRTAKERVYVYGALLWAASLAVLFVLPPGALAAYYATAALAGAGASVAYLVPWSLLPDVVEEDAARTGQRREGTFYAVFIFLQKVALSVGLAGSAYLLGLLGYVNPEAAGAYAAQPEPVLRALRLLVSLVPAAFLLLSLPLALRYPISRARLVALQHPTP